MQNTAFIGTTTTGSSLYAETMTNERAGVNSHFSVTIKKPSKAVLRVASGYKRFTVSLSQESTASTLK